MTTITRDQALQVFSRRYQDTDLSDEEVAAQFDHWMEMGCLDFAFGPDGELKVMLSERRARQ